MSNFKKVSLEEFMGVSIERIPPVNPNDSRGPTFELSKRIVSLQTNACIRYKGAESGGHYHGGQDPSKKPEKTYLVYGRALFKAWNKQGQYLETEVEGGSRIIISEKVLHVLEAPFGDIVFNEVRSTTFHKEKPDTYPIDPENYWNYMVNTR